MGVSRAGLGHSLFVVDDTAEASLVPSLSVPVAFVPTTSLSLAWSLGGNVLSLSAAFFSGRLPPQSRLNPASSASLHWLQLVLLRLEEQRSMFGFC